MLLIILLVMFVVVLMVWLLALLGAIPGSPTYSPWLAFFRGAHTRHCGFFAGQRAGDAAEVTHVLGRLAVDTGCVGSAALDACP